MRVGFFALIFFSAFGLPAASAQAPACSAKFLPHEQDAANGLGRLTIEAECRRGERVTATVDDVDFNAEFDAAGLAHLAFPLTASVTKAAVRYKDGTSEIRELLFSKFGQVMRVSLLWDMPVTSICTSLSPAAAFSARATLRPRASSGRARWRGASIRRARGRPLPLSLRATSTLCGGSIPAPCCPFTWST
jgi:hypothetical protein